MMRSTLAMIFLLLSTGGAFADREARGRAIFDQHCAHCHAVDKGRPLKAQQHLFDLTRASHERTAKELRAWIENPLQVKKDTPCLAGKVDPVQAELVAAFLKARARPPAPAPSIPPARFQPPEPATVERLPSGMGDHR